MVEQKTGENDKASAQKTCTGTFISCPENSVAAVVSCNSSSAIDLPWVTIMISPRSMKFMPNVATSDERPAVTTSPPTHAPSAMPVGSAARMPRNGLMPKWTTSAKTQAENPIVAGNERSISPTVTTNTSGTTRQSATGRVTSTES